MGGNIYINPFRWFFAEVWRKLYLIPGQFDDILKDIFKYLNINNANQTLSSLGLSQNSFTSIGFAILSICIVWQIVWNHWIGIDDDNVGQNKIGTTIKKSIFAIIYAAVSMSVFTYIDSKVTNIIVDATSNGSNIIDANSLLKISANDFLKQLLDEPSLTNVKGCEGIQTKAEYLSKDKYGTYNGRATNKDIYDCYEVNSEYKDIIEHGETGSQQSKDLQKSVISAKEKNYGQNNTHVFTTNDFTLIVIGIVSTISLVMVLLHMFKIKWDIITGIYFSSWFAGGLVSRKSSAWQQFNKAMFGKFISPLVMLFLLMFAVKFLNVSLDAIEQSSENPMFKSIFKMIFCIAMFGTISTGSVYINNFIGQSGSTGGSGGSGVIAGAGLGTTASNISQTKNNVAGGTRSVLNGAKAVKNAPGNIKSTVKSGINKTQNAANKVLNGAEHVAETKSANNSLNSMQSAQQTQRHYENWTSAKKTQKKYEDLSNKNKSTNQMPTSGSQLNQDYNE